jgi:hypothetical protein
MKKVFTAVSVFPEGENPVFSEQATHIRIEDEAAGPFLVISQPNDRAWIRISDNKELYAICEAAAALLRDYETTI